MIKYNYEISVNDNKARLNKDIFLFRGNRNIHYYFSIKGARFTFSKANEDLIESSNAIYAAVTVIKPNGVEVANAIAPVEDGTIHLKVTEDLIDEEVEVGDFDLVFDLFDDNEGAVTIPKIKSQFHVQERPCTTSIGTLSGNVNIVNQAVVDLAIATQENEQLVVVDDDGKYVKTVWKTGDKISVERLNKIEEGLEDVSTQYKDIANKTIIENNKLYLVKADGTKLDEGTTLPIGSGTTNIVTKNSDVKNIGEIFKKPDNYTAWPLGNVQYDSKNNKVCMVIPSKSSHTTGQTKLYFSEINLDTYEVSELSILAEDETYGCTSQSFCILNDGTYMCVVRVHEINNIDTIVDTRKYTSTDFGKTWTNNGDLDMADGTKFMNISGLWKSVTCMIQLSNNRLIASVNNRIIYSDDNGATWALLPINPSGLGEIFLLELSNGKVLAIGRKSGVSPGSTKAPAMISTSTDYGSTWTDFSASTTILDQTANPSFGVYYKDEKLVELFYCSRYSDGTHNGFIYSQIATEDDAMNDNFKTANIIGYSKQSESGNNGINFGYMAGAKDVEDNVHLFYYDSDDTGVNWNYMKSSRTQVTFPISDNTKSIIGMWSSNKIDDRIKALLLPLQTKLNEIIISSGGTITEPEDGTMYITDDLVVYFDFMSDDNINLTEKNISSKIGAINGTIDSSTAITKYNHWLDNTISINDLQSKITNIANSFTLEYIGYVDSDTILNGLGANNAIKTSELNINAFWDAGISYLKTDESKASTVRYFASRNTAKVEKNIYQCVAVYNSSGSVNLYRNGELDNAHYSSEITDFKSWNTNLFNGITQIGGQKRAFRIYNRGLTAEEIANNYKFEQIKFKSEIN